MKKLYVLLFVLLANINAFAIKTDVSNDDPAYDVKTFIDEVVLGGGFMSITAICLVVFAGFKVVKGDFITVLKVLCGLIVITSASFIVHKATGMMI